ncbi:hypothetical protein LJK88_10185 [Paenibacillus sp. P26]|nr:hypothetical protein LJK88_10185 [Paenibacillus sp. P26]UUZ97832.1 hypothetical protein LJK87_27475 [Paenibacillus sp. P25]
MQTNGSAFEVREDTLVSEALDGPSCCRLTQRIVIVSPMPSALNGLVGELTSRCYDVLVLHRPDPETIGSLRAELLIADRTHDEEPGSRAEEWAKSGLPVLHLVTPESWRRMNNRNETFLTWPSPLPETLGRIRLLSNLNQASLISSAGQTRFKDLLVDAKRIAVYRGTNGLS